jgi:hypothetical protein
MTPQILLLIRAGFAILIVCAVFAWRARWKSRALNWMALSGLLVECVGFGMYAVRAFHHL